MMYIPPKLRELKNAQDDIRRRRSISSEEDKWAEEEEYVDERPPWEEPFPRDGDSRGRGRGGGGYGIFGSRPPRYTSYGGLFGESSNNRRGGRDRGRGGERGRGGGRGGRGRGGGMMPNLFDDDESYDERDRSLRRILEANGGELVRGGRSRGKRGRRRKGYKANLIYIKY